MKVGIDLDEVLAEQLEELVKFYHAKTGKLIPKENFHTYYWPDVWKIPLEAAIKVDYDFKNSEHFDNIKPVDNAVEAINKLVKNNELFIITSRPVLFKEKTEKWIKRHLGELPIRIIHAAYPSIKRTGDRKSKICKDLGIKIMLEDQEIHALDCAENGIKVILFDKPWNKNINHKNIIRVNNWVEALKEIEILKLKI